MNNSSIWYETLSKPTWSPPSYLFGPVWSLLYTIIFITYATVFYKIYTKEIPLIVALPFVLNLIFNFAFTYFQFGIKNNILASIDIIFILITLIWALFSIYPYIKWISFANIPYLLWVSFATVLQLTITWMNR